MLGKTARKGKEKKEKRMCEKKCEEKNLKEGKVNFVGRERKEKGKRQSRQSR